MTSLPTKQGSKLLAGQLDYVLLDGSGSMTSKWFEATGAVDVLVDCLTAAGINSHIVTQVFDTHDLESIQRDCSIHDWYKHQPLGAYWGGTPLYDAIQLMCRRLLELDPPKASILIITDGKEVSSRHTTAEQARALLDWCRSKGWQVTFFGCDFNNSLEAKKLGVGENNCVGIQKALMSDAARNFGEKRVRHGLHGHNISFTDDEKQQFGGYLAAPKENC